MSVSNINSSAVLSVNSSPLKILAPSPGLVTAHYTPQWGGIPFAGTTLPSPRACYRTYAKIYLDQTRVGTYIGFAFNCYGTLTPTGPAAGGWNSVALGTLPTYQMAGALMNSDGQFVVGAQTGLPTTIIAQSAPSTWLTAIGQLTSNVTSTGIVAAFQFQTPAVITKPGIYWLQLIHEVSYYSSGTVYENQPAVLSYGADTTPIANDAFNFTQMGFCDSVAVAGPIASVPFLTGINALSKSGFSNQPNTETAVAYRLSQGNVNAYQGPMCWIPHLWGA